MPCPQYDRHREGRPQHLSLAAAGKDQDCFDTICRDNPDIASTLPTAGAVLLGFLAEREDLKAIGKELLNDPEDESVNLHAQPAQDPY